LSALDYVQLGGTVLASIGLIVFSVYGKVKPPKNSD